MLKVLVIGTFPPPICGTTVLLDQLVRELRLADNVTVDIMDTSGIRGKGIPGCFRMLTFVLNIPRAVWHADVVSVHVHRSSLWLGYFLIVPWCKLLKRPLIGRMFGGRSWNQLPMMCRFGAKLFVKNCRLFLLETKSLVAEAKADGLAHVRWYSNNRPMPSINVNRSCECRRFVYLGWVKKTKGVHHLLEMDKHLPDDVTIDVYGPFAEGMDESQFQGLSKVRYRGIVPPEHATRLLSKYDCLVLPTCYEGEGYPGVILESFAAGIPVITTNWKSIPEIVDTTSGILIDPSRMESLLLAINQLHIEPDTYKRLCDGVQTKREGFSSATWTETFLQWCLEVRNPD